MTLSGEVYETILANISDGVYCADLDRRIWYWSDGAERITGYGRKEVVGRSCADNLLVHVDESGQVLCLGGCPLAAAIEDGTNRSGEVYLHHKEGHRVPVQVTVMPLRDAEGRVTGAVETFRDLSSSRSLAQRLQVLEELAHLDALTDLANRRHVEMSLESRLNEMQRFGWPFGVVFADVDDFKGINDLYGHETGDRVLRMVARSMERSSRPFDIVGRWGGEEFVAVVANVRAAQLEITANRYCTLVGRSHLPVGEHQVRVTISVGATLAGAGDSAATLIGRADRLMYASKQGGKNRVTLG